MARDRHDVRAVRSRPADNTGTPIAVTQWQNMPEGAESGIDVVNIYEMHDRSIVGVHGVGTQQIEANQSYDAVHLYKDGYVERLVVADGEHKIWDGAYAAAVMANRDAVLYINGHVGTLVVSATAQVIIGHGAYIDSMQVMRGGMARIEDDAAVCNLRVYSGGRCMINDEVRINRKQYDNGSVVGYLLSKPDKECPLYVSMAFQSLAAARNCSAAITEIYRANEGIIKIGGSWTIGKLHHCQLHLGTLSFYADYVSYNRQVEEPLELYKGWNTVYRRFLPDDDMPLLKVVLHGEPVDPNAVAVVRFLDEEDEKCCDYSEEAYDIAAEDDTPVRAVVGPTGRLEAAMVDTVVDTGTTMAPIN